MLKSLQRIALISVASAFLYGCANSAQINQESAQGYAQVVNEARAKGVLDTSSLTAKRVQKVFYKMAPYADKENKTGQQFSWQINVVKNNELNAWAMPGGKMMFYTGLVDKLNLNDDEIATVMGHEMAHALQEHGKKARNIGVFTSILGAVGDAAASVALGVDTGGLVQTGVSLGVDMPYSRSNETEADEVGLMLMAKSGYNPQYAPKLWQKMQQASGGKGGISLLSTHPSDEDRQANLQRLLPQAMEYYNTSQH